MDAAVFWQKARDHEAASVAARLDNGERYLFWLGEAATTMSRDRFSTLHMCGNVWRMAAAMVEAA